jgi:hypothetical protein
MPVMNIWSLEQLNIDRYHKNMMVLNLFVKVKSPYKIKLVKACIKWGGGEHVTYKYCIF